MNDGYEAVVWPFSCKAPRGKHRTSKPSLDTGYSGFLTLPTALVMELGLSFAYIGRALLANDDEVTFGRYGSVGRPAEAHQGRCCGQHPARGYAAAR